MNQFRRFLFQISLLVGLLAASNSSWGQIKLPAVIGSNMVLQQQSNAPIWGWANKNQKIQLSASWTNESFEVKANKFGKWMITIPTPEAGGPYSLTISADKKIVLSNVMIGEVWLCSGQSNMEMPFKAFNNQPVYGSNDYIAAGNNSSIRLFNMKNAFAESPQEDCKGAWAVSSPEDVANFSAVAYSFAKYLQDKLGVPIGVINSTWGGTRVEAWMNKETLSEFGADMTVLGTDKMKFQSPTVLYNAMINPIIPYGIKGAIWYQGESNSNQPKEYTDLFAAMIKSWRGLWNQGDFPFYYVQICPMQNYDKTEGKNTAEIREAQLQTMKYVPNTGMVSTLDIGHQWMIHPPEKITIGKRLAYWALAKDYGFKGIQYGGPVYKSIKIEENKAYLKFDNAPLGLSNMGKELNDFLIAGEDKVFYPAKALIVLRKGLVVWSDEVKNPIAVRYGWSNWVVGSLFDTAGNPASSFKTDDWEK